MKRSHRLVLGCLAALMFGASGAGAQYYNYPGGVGYAGGGFGGFGGTVGGDVARGKGAFAAGAGEYNRDTAVANSINADTIARMNQYLFLSQQEANAREAARMARRQARVNAAQATAESVAQRIRTNPTEEDIASGAALNAILDQLTDPQVFSGSSLRLANAKVDAKLVRAIPFRDASDAITLSLSRMTDDKAWPAPLRDPKFAAEREAYQQAMQDVLKEDEDGDLSPATVRKLRQSITELNRRVGETIPVTRQPDHLQAVNYLKGLAGFARMLQRSNVQEVLGELEKLETTSVGNLLAFMHTYNLRFGTAEKPEERAAYQQLYPIMVSTRDKLVGKPEEVQARSPNTPARPAQAADADPTAIFHGIDTRYFNDAPASPGTAVPARAPAPGRAAPSPNPGGDATSPSPGRAAPSTTPDRDATSPSPGRAAPSASPGGDRTSASPGRAAGNGQSDPD